MPAKHKLQVNLPDRLMYTVEEAGALCGFGRTKAYELATMGIMPCLKRSARHWRVPKAWLESWIERGCPGYGIETEPQLAPQPLKRVK